MDEDLGKKELQGSQSGVSPSQALSHNKGRGKPDSSAPSVDPPLDIKSLSGDDIKEGEECVSKGLHIHQEKHTTNEDNTMDLLKDNNVKVSGLAFKTRRTITNDTVTLLKGAPSHHPSEIQVSVPEDDVLWSYDLLFIYPDFVFKGKPRIYWKAIRAISCSGEHEQIIEMKILDNTK